MILSSYSKPIDMTESYIRSMFQAFSRRSKTVRECEEYPDIARQCLAIQINSMLLRFYQVPGFILPANSGQLRAY